MMFQSAEQKVRFGPFELDSATGELRSSEGVVPLRPLATRALLVLVGRAGRLTTRDELRRALWADSALEWNQALNQCIRQLRVALGDSATQPRYLETVHGRGYRFVASVTSPNSGGSVASPSSRHPSLRFFAAGFGAALASLAAILAICSVLAVR